MPHSMASDSGSAQFANYHFKWFKFYSMYQKKFRCPNNSSKYDNTDLGDNLHEMSKPVFREK